MAGRTSADVAHGARRLFGPLSFEVRGPQRIAIRGVNGSGKTTLLRLITGHLKPTAGDISRPTDRIAVLDQHVGLLDPAASILDNLRRLNPDLSDNEARAALARFPAFQRHAEALAFHPSGQYLAAGSREGEVRLWRMEDRKQVACLDWKIGANDAHHRKVGLRGADGAFVVTRPSADAPWEVQPVPAKHRGWVLVTAVVAAISPVIFGLSAVSPKRMAVTGLQTW